MNHYASPDFWSCYRALPAEVQGLADKSFSLLKADSRHSSLHFKKVGRFWSARVGLHYRAVAVVVKEGSSLLLTLDPPPWYQFTHGEAAPNSIPGRVVPRNEPWQAR